MFFLGKAGAYNILLETLCQNKGNLPLEKACFKALITLMNKQPDLLDDKGKELMFNYLKHDEVELKRLVLKWVKECCVLHEINR